MAEDELTRAVIPPTVLAGLVEIAARAGIDPAPWLAGTGLDVSTLLTSQDLRVSYRQVRTVLGRAVRDLPDRPLGMEVGARDVLLSFGLLGLALRSSATLGHAVTTALELHQAAGSLVDVELEDSPAHPTVAVRLRERWPDPALAPFLCEEAFASSVLLARSVLGSTWAPAWVELAYPEPEYGAQYRRVLGCEVRFGAPGHRLGLLRADLDRRLPTSSEATRAVALDACRRMLGDAQPQHDVTVAVETLLAHDLRHPLGMEQVAARLHVTERTLRRQLAASGERFSAVRDRVRERRATLLLGERALGVAEVAQEVGFSDAREFRRAYRRWTGRTPSEARGG